MEVKLKNTVYILTSVQDDETWKTCVLDSEGEGGKNEKIIVPLDWVKQYLKYQLGKSAEITYETLCSLVGNTLDLSDFTFSTLEEIQNWSSARPNPIVIQCNITNMYMRVKLSDIKPL